MENNDIRLCVDDICGAITTNIKLIEDACNDDIHDIKPHVEQIKVFFEKLEHLSNLADK